MSVLTKFDKVAIDKDCSSVGGHHENELFHGCTFDQLSGLTLKNCTLNASSFITDSVRKALDFTVTLSCPSFKGVRLSELVFDLILSLLIMTVGNDQKREMLLDVIGRSRAEAILRLLSVTE